VGLKIEKGAFNRVQLSAPTIILAQFEHCQMNHIKKIYLMLICALFRIIQISLLPKQARFWPILVIFDPINKRIKCTKTLFSPYCAQGHVGLGYVNLGKVS